MQNKYCGKAPCSPPGHLSAKDRGMYHISVDYSRAFDSISHDVLISKLHKTYGILASLLQWITSFLTGRRQCVVFRGASSDWTNVLSGVHQGSVLGPLFSTYMQMTSIFILNLLSTHMQMTRSFLEKLKPT